MASDGLLYQHGVESGVTGSFWGLTGAWWVCYNKDEGEGNGALCCQTLLTSLFTLNQEAEADACIYIQSVAGDRFRLLHNRLWLLPDIEVLLTWPNVKSSRLT